VADDFELARLLGDVAHKRVLELGCGDGTRAVELARRGASVIAVDPSTEAGIATRKRAEAAEVRIELRTGDLADLAFLRGDSVDVAFAEGSLASLSDLGRVLRQVQRVLRAGAWFAFSLPHPVAACVDADAVPDGSLPLASPVVARSYFDDLPYGSEVHPHRIADVFAQLGRVGFRVDTLLEPEPPATARGRALLPDTVIWRARKIGS
jgi:SAM-dependent methyltransferase